MRASYLKVLKVFPTLLAPRNVGPWQIKASEQGQLSEVSGASEMSEVSEAK